MLKEFVEGQSQQERLSGKPNILLVYATRPGGHKHTMLRAIESRHCGMHIAAANPHLVDEALFNRSLSQLPPVIAALKTEQLTINSCSDTSAKALGDFFNQVVVDERNRREGDEESWADLNSLSLENTNVFEIATDVMVDIFNPRKNAWEVMYKPEDDDPLEKIQEKIRGRLAGGVSSLWGDTLFRSRVGVAVRGLWLEHKSFKVGVATQLESFFNLPKLSQRQLERFFAETSEELIRSVNGGLPLAEGFLNDRITLVNNTGSTEQDLDIERSRLSRRLFGAPEEVFHLSDELLRMGECGTCHPNGFSVDVQRAALEFFQKAGVANVYPAEWYFIHSMKQVG